MESWMFLAPCVCQAAAVRLDATIRQSACDMVAGESSFPLSSRRQLKVSHWDNRRRISFSGRGHVTIPLPGMERAHAKQDGRNFGSGLGATDIDRIGELPGRLAIDASAY